MRTTKGAEILRLLQEGLSYNEIVSRVGCAKSTIHYYGRQLGKTQPFKRHNWAEIQAYHNAGHSLSECREKFGICNATWFGAVKRGDLVVRDWRIPIDELLSDGRCKDRKHLKQRLINAGLLAPFCAECGITEWRGKPIPLELHHINGDGMDNRLENLTILCPNCHSQTPNYCTKNIGRRLKPTPDSSTP